MKEQQTETLHQLVNENVFIILKRELQKVQY